MCYKKLIIKTVVITALIYNSHAILITSPLANTNVVANSTTTITWAEANIPRFDIQLKKYDVFLHDNHTVALLASNIDSSSGSHSIVFPLELTTKPILYKLVIIQKNSVLTSVGPLKFILPAVKAKDASTTNIIQQPSSILVTPLLTAPIKTLNINNSNATVQMVNTTDAESNIVHKDYGGLTVSSGQIAGVSMCIVAISSFIICVYTFSKSYIDERRASRQLIDSTDCEDPINQKSTSPNNHSSVPDLSKSSTLNNIVEEDPHYEKMFYSHQHTDGYKEGLYYLAPTSGQRSTSTIQRISTDDNVFGQPYQSMEFYAGLPLPAKPLYGSRSSSN